MSEMDKYYQILGLNPGVSREAIREAYRDLAKVWHPDRFPNDPRLKEKANEKLKEINIAYETLIFAFAEEAKRYTTSGNKSEGQTQPPPHEPPPKSEKVQPTADSYEGHGRSEASQEKSFEQPLPPEVKGLFLYQEGFGYRDKRYKYEDIINLSFANHRVTYPGFLLSSSSSNLSTNLDICVNTGEYIRISSQGYDGRWIKIGGHKIWIIEQAYTILMSRSFHSRLHHYLNQLNNRGYINYRIGYFGSTIKIHKNGIVEQGNKRVDLKIAKRNKLLKFGTYGAQPYSVLMSERGLGVFDKKISFEAYCDTDILTGILIALADGKSLG